MWSEGSTIPLKTTSRGCLPFDVRSQVRGSRVTYEVQARGNHELVAGEIVCRPREVDCHVALEERPVISLELLNLADPIRRLGRQLERPPRFPVDQDCDICFDPAAADRVQSAELAPELDHLAPRR